MRTAALSLLATIALTASAFADFEKANAEFAAGNYKTAITDYEAEVAAHRWSANLFYDLGNAYFRVNDLGRAILNYERALQLDPHHPETETNLRIARDQSRGLELTQSDAEKYFAGVGISALVIAAAVCFWLGVILLILRRRASVLVLAIVCLLLAGGCGWAVWILENGTQGKGAAVVVGENVEARVATADTARSVLALPPGSEVVILQERGDWNYAALPNNQRGWIAADAADKVRL